MTTMQFVGFIVAPFTLVGFGAAMLFITRDRDAAPQPDLFGHRTITPGE